MASSVYVVDYAQEGKFTMCDVATGIAVFNGVKMLDVPWYLAVIACEQRAQRLPILRSSVNSQNVEIYARNMVLFFYVLWIIIHGYEN